MSTYTPSPENHAADPSEDALYGVLSDKRRRYTIHFLKQRGEPVTVRELSEQVAAWENDKPISAVTSKERKRVYVALYQSHLSTMDDEGLVDYDEEAGEVELSDSMADVDLYLEVVPRESVPWSIYYAGLTIANGLLLLLAMYDVEPFGRVPDLGWSVIVLVSFGASAFIQLYYTRQMRVGDDGPPPELDRD